jgi:hypothetical protein
MARYRHFSADEFQVVREHHGQLPNVPSTGIEQFAPEQRQFVHHRKVGTQLGQIELRTTE